MEVEATEAILAAQAAGEGEGSREGALASEAGGGRRGESAYIGSSGRCMSIFGRETLEFMVVEV